MDIKYLYGVSRTRNCYQVLLIRYSRVLVMTSALGKGFNHDTKSKKLPFSKLPINEIMLLLWLYLVYVHNAGIPAFYDTTTLNVTVLDVNDNSPVFTSSASRTLSIPENANMAVVHTIEASDADLGDNGRLTYYISGKHQHLQFRLKNQPSAVEF